MNFQLIVQSAEKKKCLLIIPAFNEVQSIESVVEEVQRICPQYDYVIVNDGSQDGTALLCRKKGFHMIDMPINLGLRSAFRAGMRYADRNHYDYALQLDGDGQHDPAYIAQMVDFAENHGSDIVIGSRYIGSHGERRLTLRMLGNYIIRICIRYTTGHKLYDVTSGMRLYNRRMIHVFATKPDMSPEPDTLAFLIRCHVKIDEYPVCMKERVYGKSYLGVSQSIKYMFNTCISILIMQWFRNGGGVK